MRRKDKKKVMISAVLIIFISILVLYYTQGFTTSFSVISGISTCSYSGTGVYEKASCSIKSDYVGPPSYFEGVAVEKIDIEYAPDCVFTGTMKINYWSENANQVVWSGSLVGKRDGTACIFFEPPAINVYGGEAVIVQGRVDFVKEWHDCEVCQTPAPFTSCSYDTNWERYQQTRTNYYCGGEYTNWKCKSYTQLSACEGQTECSTHDDCTGGKYCVHGFCKSLIIPGGAYVSTTSKQLNSRTIIIIIALIILMGALLWIYKKVFK